MTSYSVHFIIASVLSLIFAAIQRNTIKKRIIASVCAPFILYVFFYNYDYGLMKGAIPFIISYAGAIFAAYLSLLIVAFHRIPKDTSYSTRPLIKILFSEILWFVLLCIIFAIPWAIDTFPLSNVEAILFTLFAGDNEGAENFVISSLSSNVFSPVLKTFIIVLCIQLIISFTIHKTEFFFGTKLWKIKFYFNNCDFLQTLWQLQKTIIIICCIYSTVLLLVLPGIILSTPFKAFFQRPIDSALYREHYIHPDSVKIDSHGNPANLIVIFMESMEKNFKNFTPEITSLEKANLDFIPGGQNVSGTSWTIAGITGKLCGIPLNMPMGIEEYLGKLPTYLPYAKCLMNILAEKGFNQLYMQGTSGDFTQKRSFWNAHGNVAVHDIEYYKKVGKIPENFNVFWGFEDRKLYQFAKEELDSLSSLNKPFALYMLTVDTHQPFGYLDDSCKIALKDAGIATIGENSFPEALRCASLQLESFIKWMKKQSWFDKTVIFVMGDHTAPHLSSKAGVPSSDSLYWTNFVINSTISKNNSPHQERVYSSLDMFPTILESMGFYLDGHAIGLGRSLYSNHPTLLETFGRKSLDSLLRERSIQYDYFLMGH